MIVKIEGTCQKEGCDKPAKVIVCGYGTGLGCFCEEHGDDVAQEGNPEYTVSCPNCGCVLSVN